MVRGEKETFTCWVRRRKGAPRKLPTASSLVAAMFVEELRSFFQVSADISLELLGRADVSTVGWVDNSIYFTQEQFVTRIPFPISSLVKQFLHYTQAPLVLIHPNVFWILVGCNVLNSLYWISP